MDNKNILLATILSVLVLVFWTWFYEKPRMEKFQAQQEVASQQIKTEINEEQTIQQHDQKSRPQRAENVKNTNHRLTSKRILLDEDKAVSQTLLNRIKIKSNKLSGSINLQGAQFDNLYLTHYKETIDKNAKNVTLLAPVNSKTRYFADFGWISSDKNIDLPNSKTLWQSNDKTLSPNQDIKLSWKNNQNLLFNIIIKMDEDYLFHITKTVRNLSDQDISIASYGRINRLMAEAPMSNYILHEGAIGVFDGILNETKYADLEEESQNFTAKKGWLGITDKYWLTAIIPDNNNIAAVFNYENNKNGKIYNVEFVSEELTLAKGEELELNNKLFAGAKKVTLLDQYSKDYDIELFDRAVDFGWYYFLTKPFFFILKSFNDLLGNYGLAILAITILIKLAMLPLATKSYKAMAKIKKFQPEIEKIRKKNKDNKMQMNKEMMEFYKKEQVNPASGCLPMLIQIPVFFSLYKVLFITIDMRHQPFYGWIKDLSAPDPTSIFNLFGLLPFEINGGFLMIGIWPILMGLTMILQQKLGPKISDPAQAKVMKILPIILIFVFAAFPAGLLIYWTWNNILSIIQQYIITKKVESTK